MFQTELQIKWMSFSRADESYWSRKTCNAMHYEMKRAGVNSLPTRHFALFLILRLTAQSRLMFEDSNRVKKIQKIQKRAESLS